MWVLKMGHYAKVVDGVVTRVIVAEPDFFDTFVDDSPGNWLKTSYNTRGGIYYEPNSNIPADPQPDMSADEGRKRKNYASFGYTYDSNRDAFIPPQPFASWTLNEDSCLWESPTPYPEDGQNYLWDENIVDWVLLAEE